MPEPTDRAADLKALQCLITEAHLLLGTVRLPEGRATRARELLTSAIALADDLVSVPPAAALGQRGGLKTAERGPASFVRSLRSGKRGLAVGQKKANNRER